MRLPRRLHPGKPHFFLQEPQYKSNNISNNKNNSDDDVDDDNDDDDGGGGGDELTYKIVFIQQFNSTFSSGAKI